MENPTNPSLKKSDDFIERIKQIIEKNKSILGNEQQAKTTSENLEYSYDQKEKELKLNKLEIEVQKEREEVLKLREQLHKQIIDNKKSETEIDILKKNADNESNEHNTRLGFARKIFWIVIGYMIIVLACMICNAIEPFCWFYLSEKTLGYLLGSTAVSVIGLLASAMKYLLYKK